MVYLTSPKWSCGGYCHHLCMLSVCYFFHISIFFLENLGLIGSKLGRNIFLLEVPQHCIWFFWVPFRKPTLLLGPVILSSWLIFQISNQKPQVWCTGTCFTQKIYDPSSSLLQGKHLPFSASPLRLNIFRLFVILSLTQLYRYTPKIFLFSTATFKYIYRAPLRQIGQE